MPPPPALPDDLLEEAFLRLPPDEPACLLRASLASKAWLGLLAGRRFRARYRDFHGALPMLGFVYSLPPHHVPPEEQDDDNLPRFVPTAKFRLRIPAVEDWRGWHKDYAACDCRHGRVLFCSNNDVAPLPLVVWDPMTGRRRLLHAPEDYDSSAAAVLCRDAVAGGSGGCDHRGCHDGPFQVVFLGLYNNDDGGGGRSVAYAHVSLPEEAVVVKWSKPCSIDLAMMEDAFVVDRPPVFIRDALYFTLVYDDEDGDDRAAILRYGLVSNCLSFIDAPPVKTTGLAGDLVLMAMEDGSLGFAHVDGLTLNLWSRHVGSDGVASWPLRRVINLVALIPIQNPIQNPKEKLRLIGSVEGSDIIFVTTTDHDIYEISLKSLRWKKIWKREKCRALFPYMSFYNAPVSARG